MTITLNGTTGITTPALTNEGGLSGTTGIFSGLISANGGQIKFPATQSASTDANTLDDYEEGTFTPAFTATGSTFSYAYQSGYYTKVGKLVTVMAAVALNSSGNSLNSSALSISGLPFSQQAGALYWFVTPVRFSGVTSNYGGIGVLSTGTAVDIYFYTASAATPATMLANNLANNAAVIVNFTYSVA